MVLVTFWSDRFLRMPRALRKTAAAHMTKVRQPSEFAVFGVNVDSPELLAKLRKSNEVTWANCSDRPNGPLAAQWHVTAFPTMVHHQYEMV